MKLSIAVAFLPLLLFPSPLRAEVWRCPQENGPDIFTNLPSDASKCEKYVSSTELIPAPSPASPPPASNSQASPAILVPYAHDGPTPPEYNVPYYPDYPDYPDYYYSYPFYPYYGLGFFGFRRPHSRFAPGFSHPRGRSFNGGRSLGGGRSFGGGHSSGHR